MLDRRGPKGGNPRGSSLNEKAERVFFIPLLNNAWLDTFSVGNTK